MKRALLILRDALSQILRTIAVAHRVRRRFQPLRWLGERVAAWKGLFSEVPNYTRRRSPQ